MPAIQRRGLDAATILTPYASRIAALGFVEVGRYLKSLTGTEIAALHAAGLAVWLIDETTATRALGGAAAAVEDVQVALSRLRTLGAPAGVGVYLTVDTDVGAANDSDGTGGLAQVLAYSRTYQQVMRAAGYRVGAYADGIVLHTDATLDFRWLPAAMGWTGSRDYTGETIRQGPQINPGKTAAWGGIVWPALPFPYDPDIIMADDIGAWQPTNAPQPAAPTVYPAPEVPDAMTLQGALKAAGLYRGTIDGLWGPQSAAALADYYRALRP